MEKKTTLAQLVPVMLCFFAMGFVDLVGGASNFLQKDLNLTDSEANLFPSLVFFWFLIFSVPTSMLMNKIGRKNTVLVSLVVTLGSLVAPMFGSDYTTMLVAFSLLGIGNAIMQTSLNPLVSNLIGGDRLASTLTFGQFVKAIASFLAPIILMWGATTTAPTLGLGWRVLFPIYAVVGVLSVAVLAATSIEEEKTEKGASVLECLKLLGEPFILLCFLGIICHVGIDVGTNTTAPKLLMERLGWSVDEAAFATSLYFIFRTIGCFTGSGILQKMSSRGFLWISVILMLAGMALLFVADSQALLYAGIACIGYGNSNVFSICFSQALNSTERKNEVSGLMIMGLFGGTLFPIAMGLASDAMNAQAGAVAVMTVGVVYLIGYAMKLKS